MVYPHAERGKIPDVWDFETPRNGKSPRQGVCRSCQGRIIVMILFVGFIVRIRARFRQSGGDAGKYGEQSGQKRRGQNLTPVYVRHKRPDADQRHGGLRHSADGAIPRRFPEFFRPVIFHKKFPPYNPIWERIYAITPPTTAVTP